MATKTEINDGLHARFPIHSAETLLGIDDEGCPFAYNTIEKTWWSISTCCGASDKGTDYGIVCRSCYADFDGNCWVVLDGEDIILYSKRGTEYSLD